MKIGSPTGSTAATPPIVPPEFRGDQNPGMPNHGGTRPGLPGSVPPPLGELPGTDTEHHAADLEQAVGDLNRMAASLNTQLRFEVHSSTGRFVVKVVDGNTGKTVKQIPPEQLLESFARLQEAIGVLFDRKM